MLQRPTQPDGGVAGLGTPHVVREFISTFFQIFKILKNVVFSTNCFSIFWREMMAVAAKWHRKTPKATTGIRDRELHLYYMAESTL